MINNNLTVTFLLVCVFSIVSISAQTKTQERPNVLIIVTDDQYEFGFESGRATTPNIDKIVAEGMYFNRAYTTAACTPTRYNILAGKYASSCKSPTAEKGVFSDGTRNITWIGNLSIDQEPVNLANTFQRSGYFTGHVGKMHNEILHPDSAINKQRYESVGAIDEKAPLADMRNNQLMKTNQLALQETMKSIGYDYAAAVVSGNLPHLGWPELVAHNQEWMTKGAVDFLDIAKDKEEPFFLYVATTLDHGPHNLRRSLDEDPRKSPEGYLDEPITGYQTSRADVIARAAKVENGKFGSTMWLDDGIGAIMQKLKDIGANENTIVVFMTDHAVNGGKASCYEGGVNPPVVFRWKGHFEATTTESLIHTVDYLPTFIDLCDLNCASKKGFDGKDFSSILYDKTAQVHSSVLVEFGVSRGVVTDQYKYIATRTPEYIISPEQLQKEVDVFQALVKEKGWSTRALLTDPQFKDFAWPKSWGAREGNKPEGTYKQPVLAHFDTMYDIDQLFDLKKDPREQNNLAYDPAYQKVLKEMQHLLKKELKGINGHFGEFKE